MAIQRPLSFSIPSGNDWLHHTDASIVIPTQNRAAWLPTCLAHLEQQTFPAARFEIIVADDGSTDDTFSVLERYAQGSPIRIRPLRLEKRGFAAARNEAVKHANGHLLLFLADDELASPRLLERHWEAHADADHEQCLYGEVHAHPQLPPQTLTRLFMVEAPPVDEYTELISYLDAQASNVSLARTLYERSGGFDEDSGLIALDHVAWAYRLFKAGVETRRVADARSYVWQPALLDRERARFYDMGYAFYHLLRLTRSSAIMNRYNLDRGPIEQTLSAFLVPFYARAYHRQHRENPVFAGSLQRRILQHDRATGFNDARYERPRRPPE
jgi:glycosyltransferase involved in cell wall biosynthesis